mmetsp:Transcript_8342/g.24480  ORF Transcript_8342/g.24480 Transcript_8342/m.24480 type:complete len:309 (+) Transcript_8342:856-1782(+)
MPRTLACDGDAAASGGVTAPRARRVRYLPRSWKDSDLRRRPDTEPSPGGALEEDRPRSEKLIPPRFCSARRPGDSARGDAVASAELRAGPGDEYRSTSASGWIGTSSCRTGEIAAPPGEEVMGASPLVAGRRGGEGVVIGGKGTGTTRSPQARTASAGAPSPALGGTTGWAGSGGRIVPGGRDPTAGAEDREPCTRSNATASFMLLRRSDAHSCTRIASTTARHIRIARRRPRLSAMASKCATAKSASSLISLSVFGRQSVINCALVKRRSTRKDAGRTMTAATIAVTMSLAALPSQARASTAEPASR